MKKAIQTLIFPDDKEKRDLYFKGSKFDDTDIAKQGILISPKGSLTFDTYFNSISLKKWKNYTRLKNLKFHCEIEGYLKLTVVEATHINQKTTREKEQAAYIYQTNGMRQSIDINIKLASDADMIFIKINNFDKGSVFYSGEFYSDIADFQQLNDVNIAVGICTFKREEFVLKNLAQLNRDLFSEKSEVKDKIDVFGSDNGHSLPISELSNQNIRIFENANLGGSGGFCRCMLEAVFNKSNTKKYSHVLVMDDDILFESETIIRLYNFLSLLKEEYRNAMIAFSMFPIETPCVQYTKGKIRENNTSKCLHADVDLRFYKNVLANEKENAVANFSGWWCHCIPTSYITASNLPFPFFIRCDDTEYGCRYQNTIITLNGLGIWHPSFEGKHPISMSYYDMRNNLIFMTEGVNAVTKDKLLTELFYAYKNALYMDYDKAMLAMQGIEDFIAGPDFLKNADFIEINNAIRKKNYKMVPPPENKAAQLAFIPTKIRPASSVEALNLFAFLPAFRTKYINCDKRNVSLLGVRKLYCYNIETNTGHYLTKSRIKAHQCKKQYKRLRKQIECNFVEIVENWRKNMAELTSMEFWMDKLNLDASDYHFQNEPLQVEPYEFAPLTDPKDGAIAKLIKRVFPWYTKIGANLRKNFLDAPHFTVRSDFQMHMTFWKRKLIKMLGLSSFNREMKDLRQFKDIHKGERCFITCTGPSLSIDDLEALKDEYTFGVNSITKAYPYTNWRPTYYVLIDAYAYGESLKKDDVFGGKFCEKESFMHYRVTPKYLHGNEHFIPISYSNHWKYRMDKGIIKICDDPSVGLYDCFTVTNMAIQIAAYMGFKDIYILGADATYKLEKTHFIEGEWEKIHKKAQKSLALAVQRSMIGYIRTRDYYNKRGVNIYNATRGGMLEVFPRKNLDDVLREK